MNENDGSRPATLSDSPHRSTRRDLSIQLGLTALLLLLGCSRPVADAAHDEHPVGSSLVVSRPLRRDTLVTRDYVCQIRASRSIEIRALERGYLESLHVREGQQVQEGETMFKILPLVYRAELGKAEAECRLARVEYENTRRLAESNVVSSAELALSKAKLDRAEAEQNLAQAHLGFTEVKAPFTGLMDRLHLQKGSLVHEGDLLTTLSDVSHIWAYFNVSEAEYLEYAAAPKSARDRSVQLVMANGKLFNQAGAVNTVEAEFNPGTGTIPFRADFPNPDGLLRHGETGNIRMTRRIDRALLVPQKATFEILDQHYVFVVGKDDILKQRRIRITDEIEDLFIVSEGLSEEERIVVEGLRDARDGQKASFHFEDPDKVFSHLKLHAE